MFKHVAQRTEKRATVRKPKDRRNGRFSGESRPCLNPSSSFLLLFCGKKVGETIPRQKKANMRELLFNSIQESNTFAS
jgi:hypothetical protein